MSFLFEFLVNFNSEFHEFDKIYYVICNTKMFDEGRKKCEKSRHSHEKEKER